MAGECREVEGAEESDGHQLSAKRSIGLKQAHRSELRFTLELLAVSGDQLAPVPRHLTMVKLFHLDEI